MRVLILLCLVGLAGCGASAPDLNVPGTVSSTRPDEHGVVCYTTRYRGEFSCVKVK